MKKVTFENLEILSNGSALVVNCTFKKEGSATDSEVFSSVRCILREVSKISTNGGEDIRISGNNVIGQIRLM